jgi:hypothetical protein
VWNYVDSVGGGKHSLSKRGDLGNDVHQSVLRTALRARGFFFCGCRPERKLKLIPYRLSEKLVGLRRFRISDRHAEGCFAEQLDPISEPGVADGTVDYTDNIFLGKGVHDQNPPKGNAGGDANKTRSRRWEDFTHFFQAQFTKASLEAFSTANVGRSYRDSGLVNPTLGQIFGRLVAIMGLPIMHNRSASPSSRLGSLGLKLLWGLTAQQLALESDNPLDADEVLEYQVDQHWDYQGFQRIGPLLEIPGDVLSSPHGKVKAMGYLILPPYLFATVFKPGKDTNQVIELYRIPIALAGGTIFPVESEAERSAITVLFKAGVSMIKLHVQGDLRLLGNGLWPFRTNDIGRIPSRPDVIAFVSGQVRILYLTDSVNPAYLAKVAESVSEMKAFLASPDVFVKAVAADAITPETWREAIG